MPKDGPITLKSFPDLLKDLMKEEIAEQRSAGGPLTTYAKVIADALQKRYAERRQRAKLDDQRITADIAERAGLETDESFLGGI